MIRRAVVAIVAVGISVAGCSSDPAPPASGHASAATTTTPTHWWSGTDYCDILRETLRAGKSILPGATAADPDVLVATKAFVADVTAAAPGDVRAQWQTLGPALTALVASRGKPTATSGANTRLVAAAAAAIARDAKSRCSVNVSA